MYLSGPCHRAFTAKLEEKKSGFRVSSELLKQLGAFRASCRNPKTGLPQAPTRGFGALSPAMKIEIENGLEMALSKVKSGSAWQSHFWQCGTLRPAQNAKLFTLRKYSKSKLGFV